MASENPINVEMREGVAILHVDDGAVNALSYVLVSQLSEAIVVAQDDASASAIVLAGNQKCLSAGLDLNEVQKGPEAAQAIIQAAGQLFGALFTCPKPIVVACTGHAMAGGAVILVTGDYHIGRAGKYKIGYSEVPIGIALPDAAIAMSQYRMTGAAAEIASLGEITDPEGALKLGFFDELVDGDRDAVVAAAHARAAALGARPAEAYAQTKLSARADVIAKFYS